MYRLPLIASTLKQKPARPCHKQAAAEQLARESTQTHQRRQFKRPSRQLRIRQHHAFRQAPGQAQYQCRIARPHRHSHPVDLNIDVQQEA